MRTERLVVSADDTVLEITESETHKTRLSLKALERTKKYLRESISNFQAREAEVDQAIAKITQAKNATGSI